jgi:hypothetical protein
MLERIKRCLFRWFLKMSGKIPPEAALEAKREYISRFDLKPGLLENLLTLMEEDIDKGIHRKEVLRKYFWH